LLWYCRRLARLAFAITSCQTVPMTFPSSSDASSWSIRIGRTDGEFLVGLEKGYDDEGFLFQYEYTYLDYDAVVDVRLERTGESVTYAEALSQVRGYVSRLVGTSFIVQFSAGRHDAWSFMATGWMPVDEALLLLDSREKACAA
jgi:hypothetical protein